MARSGTRRVRPTRSRAAKRPSPSRGVTAGTAGVAVAAGSGGLAVAARPRLPSLRAPGRLRGHRGRSLGHGLQRSSSRRAPVARRSSGSASLGSVIGRRAGRSPTSRDRPIRRSTHAAPRRPAHGGTARHRPTASRPTARRPGGGKGHKFKSKAQWRWAFATHRSFAHRWAHANEATGGGPKVAYRALPRRKRRPTSTTLR